jgi:hypothetical protein
VDPRSWQAVTVTCVKNGFQKVLGDTSTPEIDHEESTSENEFSDVPEEIINALHSIVILMIFLVLSDLIVLFVYNE